MGFQDKITTLDNVFVLVKMWYDKGLLTEEAERLLSNAIANLNFTVSNIMQKHLKR